MAAEVDNSYPAGGDDTARTNGQDGHDSDQVNGHDGSPSGQDNDQYNPEPMTTQRDSAGADGGYHSHQRSNSNPEAKKITVYKNGDLFFPAKKLVINKRNCRTWDAFLQQVTDSLKLGVRNIQTPKTGTRVFSLDDIRGNGNYVAVPLGERFKIVNYDNVQDPASPRRLTERDNRNYNGVRLKPIQPVFHSRLRVEGRITHEMKKKGKTIYVYKNGDPFTRAICVLLKTFEQNSWEQVLRAVDDKVCLLNNKAIRRLYTMDGQLCYNANTLEDSHYYVATGYEPFHAVNYGQNLPYIRAGKFDRRQRVKYLNAIMTPPKNSKRDGRYSEPASNTSTTERRMQQHHQQRPQPAQSQQQQRYRETDYDEDRGGVYRSKEKDPYRSDAQEVEDSKKTRNEKARDEKGSARDKAATQIQAGYRGYSTRKRVAQEKKVSPSNAHRSQPAPARRTQPRSQSKRQAGGKKDEKDRNAAASRIQAGYRGMQTRRGLKQDDSQDEQSNERTNRNDNKNTDKSNKSKPAKKEDGGQQDDEQDDEHEDDKPQTEEDQAASRIQAGYRGHKTRQNLVKKKQQDAAATKIQAGFKGYKTRKTVANNKTKQEAQAKETIKASAQGHKTRQETKTKEDEKAKETIKAGAKGYAAREEQKKDEQAKETIKAGAKGYAAREEQKKDEQAKETIKAGVKGYESRQDAKQSQEKDEAATKIQAGFRGHQTRKKLANEKQSAES